MANESITSGVICTGSQQERMLKGGQEGSGQSRDGIRVRVLSKQEFFRLEEESQKLQFKRTDYNLHNTIVVEILE